MYVYIGDWERISYGKGVGIDYGNNGDNGFDLKREIWDVEE